MASCKVKDEAFVTLATNDVYARGAMVLAESLKMHGTSRQIVVMITPQVSPLTRSALENIFDAVRVVDVMDSEDSAHLALLSRPELGVTFTKIHCWMLTEYKKCVFMDADMMALQNIDELFDREELSAARDSGWPDIFNSGLYVFCPSVQTFNELLQLAKTEGSFDGGDQGLLNTYFSDWSTGDISRHLPFLYNLHVTSSYTYLPAFRKFGKDTKVVHFLGPMKPWHQLCNKSTASQTGSQHSPQFLSQWWSIYNDKVHKYFSKEQETTGSNGTSEDASVTTSDDSSRDNTTVPSTPHVDQPTPQEGASSSSSVEDHLRSKWEHKGRWERGEIDYQGVDKFENIQALLDTYL